MNTTANEENIPADKAGLFDLQNIDRAPLDQLLTTSIADIQSQVQPARVKLEPFTEVNDTMVELISLLTSVERILMHFEFTLAALKTNTQDEMTALKEKFSLIKENYEKVGSSDDLTPVPAKYAVYVIYTKFYPKLKKTLDEAFQKGSHGETKVLNTRDVIIQAKVARKAFEFASDRYHYLLTMDKNNIFVHEKSSPVWQELFELVAIKKIAKDEEIERTVKKSYSVITMAFNLVKGYRDSQNSWGIAGPLSVARNIAYFATHRDKVQIEYLHNLLNAQVEDIVRFWNLPGTAFFQRLDAKIHPKIGHDELIYIPKMFPRITKEALLREYEENTFNKIHPMNISVPTIYGITASKDRMFRELLTPSEDKVPVRIFALEPLNYKDHSTRETTKTPSIDETAVILHIHGGGFIAMDSLIHKAYLGKWVQNLKVVIFAVDYRLAPKNPYPDGVDDVWQAYLWITNYAESVLGIKTPKIIISGDSAGGSLALALLYRLIRAGIKPPHGALLIYPSLHMDAYRTSPGRFLHFDNPILPVTFMRLIGEAYVGPKDDIKVLEDPYISPLEACDDFIAKLPPIRISIGTDDPLHDDCWTLLERLKKMGRDVKMVVYDNLPHGYIQSKNLKNYESIIEDHCNFIRDLVAIEN